MSWMLVLKIIALMFASSLAIVVTASSIIGDLTKHKKGITR